MFYWLETGKTIPLFETVRHLKYPKQCLFTKPIQNLLIMHLLLQPLLALLLTTILRLLPLQSCKWYRPNTCGQFALGAWWRNSQNAINPRSEPARSLASTGIGLSWCSRFGEYCFCCCLPLLPQLACRIHAPGTRLFQLVPVYVGSDLPPCSLA